MSAEEVEKCHLDALNAAIRLMPDLDARLADELAPLLGRRGTTADQLAAAKQKALIKIAEAALAEQVAELARIEAAKPSPDQLERDRVRGFSARRQSNRLAAMAPAAREQRRSKSRPFSPRFPTPARSVTSPTSRRARGAWPSSTASRPRAARPGWQQRSRKMDSPPPRGLTA